MEYMDKIEREDMLADTISEAISKVVITTKTDNKWEIDVDPNFKYSEDAKFGHQLSKNDRAWYEYFGIKKF